MSMTLREAVDKVVEHTRTKERKPNLSTDRALALVRQLTEVDVSRLTRDTDLRNAYVQVLVSSDAQIAEALRG